MLKHFSPLNARLIVVIDKKNWTFKNEAITLKIDKIILGQLALVLSRDFAA